MILLHLPGELAADLGAPKTLSLACRGTLGEALQAAEGLHPGILSRLTEPGGALRLHLNAFIGERLVRRNEALPSPLAEDDEVWILRAISGG